MFSQNRCFGKAPDNRSTNMPRIWALLLIFLLFLPGLYAQEEAPSEEQPDTSIDSEWEDYSPTLYTKGDKMFIITIGTVFPTYFGGISGNNHGLGKVGGTGALGFSYFLNSNIFLGGELSAMFISTKGGNMLYIVPMGIRAGYQFVYRRFEFPLSMMIGGAPQKKQEDGYFGFIMKWSASAFWRFNPDWSFGLNTSWWFVPQWPKEGPNVNGNFFELTLSARYHF